MFPLASRSPMMPDPTTQANRKKLPSASATKRQDRGGCKASALAVTISPSSLMKSLGQGGSSSSTLSDGRHKAVPLIYYDGPVEQHRIGHDRVQQGIVSKCGVPRAKLGQGRAVLPQQATKRNAGTLRDREDLVAARRSLEMLHHPRFVSGCPDKFKRVAGRTAGGIVIDERIHRPAL